MKTFFPKYASPTFFFAKKGSYLIFRIQITEKRFLLKTRPNFFLGNGNYSNKQNFKAYMVTAESTNGGDDECALYHIEGA